MVSALGIEAVAFGQYRKNLALVSPPSPIVSKSELRHELLDEIARLERSLQDARLVLDPTLGARTQPGALVLDEEKVRRVVAARRIRERQLGEDLFADPAWDLLLEAFAADLGQKRITDLELCRATNVPESVAVRWINKLEHDGWFCRSQAGDEREWIELTPEGSVRLRQYFEVVGSALLLV